MFELELKKGPKNVPNTTPLNILRCIHFLGILWNPFQFRIAVSLTIFVKKSD